MELLIKIILNKEQKLLKRSPKREQFLQILNPILQKRDPRGLLYMKMMQALRRGVLHGVKKRKMLL
ncbi:MAG: hypothetical protein ACI81G_000154 [Gammaproteobacteria bacterium]|jgi:hypothetical protein